MATQRMHTYSAVKIEGDEFFLNLQKQCLCYTAVSPCAKFGADGQIVRLTEIFIRFRRYPQWKGNMRDKIYIDDIPPQH